MKTAMYVTILLAIVAGGLRADEPSKLTRAADQVSGGSNEPPPSEIALALDPTTLRQLAELEQRVERIARMVRCETNASAEDCQIDDATRDLIEAADLARAQAESIQHQARCGTDPRPQHCQFLDAPLAWLKASVNGSAVMASQRCLHLEEGILCNTGEQLLWSGDRMRLKPEDLPQPHLIQE